METILSPEELEYLRKVQHEGGQLRLHTYRPEPQAGIIYRLMAWGFFRLTSMNGSEATYELNERARTVLGEAK